ncbi:Protein CBG18572 [Caenorhabditis briggsae]|uniref:Protein CBG18572 n=1 Tax=Caenorhabditis briggsae TaxID=6238 RepID=A8XTL9_CAEBR|nr:Protein CBG18572 [Caenorhabditis briggsae]CAP35995.1 Protein CBG18572 [Caenorhabditis briggsae]
MKLTKQELIQVTEQAEFSFFFDLIARYANIIVSIFGLITNSIHLSILTQKSLKSNSVFLIMAMIAFFDLILLFSLLAADILYILEYNDDDYCSGLHYYEFGIASIFTNLFTIFSRFMVMWMTVAMALLRIISLKFAMSSWSEKLSKPSTAYLILLIFAFLGFSYCFAHYLLVYNIRKTPDFFMCDFPRHILTKPQYTLAGERKNHEALEFFNFLDEIDRFLQAFMYIFCTVCLAIFLRKRAKNRILQNREEHERGERTEGLIFVTIFSFVIARVPMIIYTLWIRFSDFWSPRFFITLAMTTMVIFQTINASIQLFICFFMSTPYRDVAKKMYFCERSNTRIVPSNQYAVSEAENYS